MSTTCHHHPKLRLALLLAGALTGASCAVSPTEPTATDSGHEPSSRRAGSGTVESAFAQFERRNYAGAAAAYDDAANDDAHAKRLAHLGQALIHLSTDPQWRDLDAAAHKLQAAENLGGATEVEISMLMNALSSLIGVEANISELNTKVANSASEIARLKDERQALVANQAVLNEAIEKLKALTIGN